MSDCMMNPHGTAMRKMANRMSLVRVTSSLREVRGRTSSSMLSAMNRLHFKHTASAITESPNATRNTVCRPSGNSAFASGTTARSMM